MSVYFTDILLLVLLLFWFYDSFFSSTPKLKIKNEKFKITIKNLKSQFQKPDFYLLLFIAISAISVKNSDNYLISWYQWAKLVEFVCFYWYLSRYVFKKFGLYNSFLAIFLSGIFQAIVAIIQFLKQSSIGLKYLDESVLNSDFSGVASFYISDTEKIIRAYGTTPHPNVLAVFLLLSISAFYFIYLYSKDREQGTMNIKTWGRLAPCSSFLAYTLVLFGFFLTFSRVIILSWGIVFLGGIMIHSIRLRIILSRVERMIYHKKYRREVKEIFLITLATASLFAILLWPEILSRLTIGGGDQAVELRSFYVKEALKTNINIWGVGYGNFVSWLIKENSFLPAYAYQPVHNIYLLIYAETGLLGISVFLLFLFFLLKNSLKSSLLSTYPLLLTTCFLFIGLFDHMFWTLQQGRLALWLLLALLTYNKNSDII